MLKQGLIEKNPIRHLKDRMIRQGELTEKDFAAIETELKEKVRRDYAAAEVAQVGDGGDTCGPTWVTIPAKSETTAGGIIVAPPTYYAMPASAKVKRSADGKSIIVNDGTGWIWTYTMTAVR